MAAEDLGDLQSEVLEVKRALRSGSPYLGLTGDALQRYFLQLNEKENLLHQKHLVSMQAASEPGTPLHAKAANGNGTSAIMSIAEPLDVGDRVRARNSADQPWRYGTLTSLSPIEVQVDGWPTPLAFHVVERGEAPAVMAAPPASSAAPPSAPSVAPAPARPLPEEKTPFNRESLDEVATHLLDWEGSMPESAKGLRALSSLAYANAKVVGKNEQVVSQVLRLCDLHPTEEAVWVAAMRSLCNMAHDVEVALERLCSMDVLGKLLQGLCKESMKETSARAGEALARLIAAEVEPVDAEGPVTSKRQIGPDFIGALASVFCAASLLGDEAVQPAMLALLRQLHQNEVVEYDYVTRRFVAAAQHCSDLGGSPAARWLQMSKVLALDHQELGQALVDGGAIQEASKLMERHLAEAFPQLSGIESLSALVGNRWAGLMAFADAYGIARIEASMRTHPDEAMLNTKGIRALASGVAWPKQTQDKAGFNAKSGIELTRKALVTHASFEELQLAGVDALCKYADTLNYVAEVKADGGDALVEKILADFPNNDAVQKGGRKLQALLAKSG